MKPLPQAFFRRPVLRVAPELLGCMLVRRSGDATVAGRIVEVEAYRQDDPASHTYAGLTPRNEVMFGPGGVLYVYFTYGMHFCANVVTGRRGHGEALLLRAVEPVLGLEVMSERRYGAAAPATMRHLRDLTRGPARLCQAFQLDKSDNGADLRGPHVFITRAWTREVLRVARSPRIGIRHGREKRWRFYVEGSQWISAHPRYEDWRS